MNSKDLNHHCHGRAFLLNERANVLSPLLNRGSWSPQISVSFVAVHLKEVRISSSSVFFELDLINK